MDFMIKPAHVVLIATHTGFVVRGHRSARLRRERGGARRALSIVPARSAALSLFRRRQPLSRRKEGYLAVVREMLKT